MKKLNVVSYNLIHIPESHWNNRLIASNMDLEVKYGLPKHKNDPFIVLDYKMFECEWTDPNVYGWLIEPPVIHPNHYTNITSIQNKFIKIFTHDKRLLESSDKFVFCPHGDCWINSVKNQPKRYLVSIIASYKNTTEGQKLRHDIIGLHRNLLNVFGNAYVPTLTKNIALEPFYFSIVIENSRTDYYFTEKIIDCFRTKTIPIYWGCPSIGNFFDEAGIIQFSKIDDLGAILRMATESYYNSVVDAIERNYLLSYRYDTFFHSLINTSSISSRVFHE